jgi:signal peptidase I
MKEHLKKTWNFFWNDDSVWSWLANIIVAFLVIRFIVYPVLGLLLGTSFPIVAVISESMEHGTHNDIICGSKYVEFPESFDNYWTVCGQWYKSNGITKEEFKKFPFKNGFRKGDVIILWRAHKDNIKLGDVLIFQGSKPQPLIHRVVKVWEENEQFFYQTKGDHNSDSISGNLGEKKISEDRVYGKGIIRVPYLGWMKILFVDAVKPLGINIQR